MDEDGRAVSLCNLHVRKIHSALWSQHFAAMRVKVTLSSSNDSVTILRLVEKSRFPREHRGATLAINDCSSERGVRSEPNF